jgi:hypothetical protein
MNIAAAGGGNGWNGGGNGAGGGVGGGGGCGGGGNWGQPCPHVLEEAPLQKELDERIKEWEEIIVRLEETKRLLAATEEDLKNEPPEPKRRKPNHYSKK